MEILIKKWYSFSISFFCCEGNMKKGEIFEITIEGINFKGEGYGSHSGETFYIKGGIPGDIIKGRLTRKKGGKLYGKSLEILKHNDRKIPGLCEKFGECGGCTYLSLPYEDQIKLKEKALKEALKDIPYEKFLGVEKSPNNLYYRNKMEFSFGDEFKGGPLEFGLHKKGSPFSIVDASMCKLISEDLRKITKSVRDYFKELNLKHYNLKTHEGYLRNLILREGNEEILICLVTSSYGDHDLKGFKDMLLSISLDKKIGGIIHVVSDSLSDAIDLKDLNILYGKDYIYEEIWGLKFKISLFSFFQTNSEGVKVLYDKVRKCVGNPEGTILDLYSGVGTIGQVLSKGNKVIGIEIIEDAVLMARENAKLNNLDCEFICGDASLAVKDIKDKISFIVIDPPRPGIGKKGVKNICDFNVKNILYVSCNPNTLCDDLKEFISYGYKVKSVEGVDMFPNTYHLESVVHLEKE